jgi:hypothetical protein
MQLRRSFLPKPPPTPERVAACREALLRYRDVQLECGGRRGERHRRKLDAALAALADFTSDEQWAARAPERIAELEWRRSRGKQEALSLAAKYDRIAAPAATDRLVQWAMTLKGDR